MATVFIPPELRSLCNGQRSIMVAGSTVGELIDRLDHQFTGLSDRLRKAEQLKPGLAVTIDHDICSLGVDGQVNDDSEVHFLPAIGGG